jgi:nucleotide-binding universal stress UspA family protein
MRLKHLAVHVDSSPRAAERIGLAIALARRVSATLVGIFAESEQLGRSLVGRRTPDAVRAACAKARDDFAARTTAAGLATEWSPIEATAYSEVMDLVAACCRYVDLTVVGQQDHHDERAPKDLAEHVMLQSGRPVLVVPSTGHYTDVGRRVVIAWNASREAARAVNDAIPLLQAAEGVRVVTFRRQAGRSEALPMPRTDIVAHLAAHGIHAERDLTLDEDEGASLLGTIHNRSFEFQADLTVMPGHGDRFPFPHATGSTKEILRSMTTPVLLSY